ncbi:ATP-binding protein [Streptomyces sp. NBC_00638]|uniref:ATP-binding protein n=1 Tax=unclassified Streptomyces TaxID=2593676 RepID=UPI00224D77BC|nr:ATP-binding protein [Streptomyces sp. NBC_00638]MCX5008709.1 ATP-binding protein [Streptomyces sp. NBC_00638]
MRLEDAKEVASVHPRHVQVQDDQVGAHSGRRAQVLHTKDAYKGSGIGLAMCKKIVEFHGGTTSIDLDYRDGARITFTLANEPPKAKGPSTMPEATRADTEPAP